MIFSFLSSLSLFKSDAGDENTELLEQKKTLESRRVLKNSILDANGVIFNNFTLFHHNNSLRIDLLIFLPHYGLYVGEKISWNAKGLKGSSVERYSRKNKKTPSTRLETSEKIIHQKLEDVLSFDSTQIERIFWMETLSEAEFDALDSSFHELLPKNRLIFSDDTIQSIQEKLFALGLYQETPYSKLKIIGSLQAHTLLLPTAREPFGTFLNESQQQFLDMPLTSSPLFLCGEGASGKSTVIIRKVIQMLLQDSSSKLLIITPTLLNSEIIRQEIIALADFAVIDLDFSRLQFLAPSELYAPIHLNEIPHDTTHIVCDDIQLFNIHPLLEQATVALKDKFIILSTPISEETPISHTLHQTYRNPIIEQIHFFHTKGALYTLLSKLKGQIEHLSDSPIMIILPNETLLGEYQNAISEHLGLESHILDISFSLQYKNLTSITLSTPHYISALSVSHCYLINLDPNDPLYPLALSRASESVTIISEDLHPSS